MTSNYKHLILPAVLLGAAGVASAFAMFMASRHRNTREGQQTAALALWEDEGGSVAAPEAGSPAGDGIAPAIADRNLHGEPQ